MNLSKYEKYRLWDLINFVIVKQDDALKKAIDIPFKEIYKDDIKLLKRLTTYLTIDAYSK